MKQFFNKKITIVLSLIAIFFICGITTLVVRVGVKPIKTITQYGVKDRPEGKLFVVVQKNPEKQWFDVGNPLQGAQFDGTFFNGLKSDITDWEIKLRVPDVCYIDSSWNGEYNLENGILTIKPPKEFNRLIPKNDSITFGFIMYAPKSYTPMNYSISYAEIIRLTEMPLFWILCLCAFALIIVEITSLVFYFQYRHIREKQRINEELIAQTMRTFANTIEAKDMYTKGHSRRVSVYSRELAKRAGLKEDDIQRVYYSAILYDIGKVIIPDDILNKKGRLTEEEMEVMRRHTIIGAEILRDFSTVPHIESIVRHHHERYDGTGYPDKLTGKEIPFESRIICIADCYDAMSSNRCYQTKKVSSEIIEEIKRCSGTQFDPVLADFFIGMIEEHVVPITE